MPQVKELTEDYIMGASITNRLGYALTARVIFKYIVKSFQ